MEVVEIGAASERSNEHVDASDLDEPRPPLVRSTVYVFRALIGLTLMVMGALLLLVFENGLLGLRGDIQTLQDSWPEWLVTTIQVGLGLAIAMAVLGTNGFLVYHRKWRRLIMINLSAFGAVFVGAAASHFVLAIATSDVLADAIEAGSEQGLGNDGLASVVAVLTVSSVWIGPRLRPWVVGFAAATVGLSFVGGALSVITLPFDIGVGIVAGALVALIMRTRDRTPTAGELTSTLERDRISAVHVKRAAVDARGSVPWFVTVADGDELFVKTLGSDHRAADLLFRVYRMIRLRRAGDRQPFSSLRRAVEHEAFLSLAAESRGIRTPRLVTVAEVGSDGMLLAYTKIDGKSLDAVEPSEITDEMLTNVWQLVGLLRDAAIAHRDLRLANIFIADDGVPWIIDFGFAELAADDSLLARDNAELLASTAAVVGVERAVAVAVEATGRDTIAEALPWIQPLALSSATAGQIGKSEDHAKLRSVAAAAVGIDEVGYEKLERIKPGTLLIMATAALSLYVLIPQFAAASGFFDELRGADLGWAAVVVVASALTYVGAATGMLGAVPVRLQLVPVLTAQLASSFSNRVTPAKVGGLATNVRFLQKQNLTLPMAVSAVGLNTVAGTIIHVSLLALTAVVAGQSNEVSLPVPDARTTAIGVIVVIGLSGAFMVLPIGRKLLTRNLIPALRAAASSVTAIARTPAKLFALFTGSAIVTLSYTFAMIAALNAFGADLPIATAALVYLVGSAVATAAPTPGGLGATEAALVAGYTAVGIAGSTAFAAVMLFRLITFWLPILPGWFALVNLQRTGRL
ncbi:MAG: flippase-like domain-containing protein [bacterium]|nr:flippase-like domain-containing protein [bacterium]